ncbi:hypothetical protein TNIN_371091 [Trichonephila inaurata madagascariensis]|uniref:Uncharacterized protein n=1 Tax=Trichonephila inaurata madagascariensis TaxID=2747483 RepID=A0A8X6INV7_9ARAC|nr:hypothetical protein TNIN_371091 [Trichonephila inaurata madagascariensis]
MTFLRNEFLELIMTILPPAPEELLKTIYCNFKNSCGSRCGLYESDLDEDRTFDPEILQDLETNILDGENNENESEIFEGLEDNGEKKEKN